MDAGRRKSIDKTKRREMRYARGQQPTWKSKPKASPLDTDSEFQKLIRGVTKGTIPRAGGSVIYIDQVEDGKRFGVKNPARMARDQLNRKIADLGLESKYVVTCRQTDVENEWAVLVTAVDQH